MLGDVPDLEAARALVAVLGDYDQGLWRSAHDLLACLAEQLEDLADNFAGTVAAAMSDRDPAVRTELDNV